VRLWKHGLDTAQIAYILERSEASVYNYLSRHRETYRGQNDQPEPQQRKVQGDVERGGHGAPAKAVGRGVQLLANRK
jgi:transposase